MSNSIVHAATDTWVGTFWSGSDEFGNEGNAFESGHAGTWMGL